MTPLGGKIISTNPRLKSMFMSLFSSVYFIRLRHDSHFVPKMPLNDNKANQPASCEISFRPIWANHRWHACNLFFAAIFVTGKTLIRNSSFAEEVY